MTKLGLIVITPIFWPIVVFGYFLKELNKFRLTFALTMLVGVVAALMILTQVWWITLLMEQFI